MVTLAKRVQNQGVTLDSLATLDVSISSGDALALALKDNQLDALAFAFGEGE